MILRQFVVLETACASYLFGCTTHEKLAVVDPHLSLVEEYLSAAEQIRTSQWAARALIRAALRDAKAA